MPPVEVTVMFEGSGSVIAFDVMPSFEQLVYCIRCDIVKSHRFELHSRTMRGSPVLLKDQHALNRVSSDGSPFTVEVLRVDSPTKAGSSAATQGASNARAASPAKKKTGSGGILSPLQPTLPAASSSDGVLSYEGGRGASVVGTSTSPLRSSRLFAPVHMGSAQQMVASNLARAASATRLSPSRPASSVDLLGNTVTSEWAPSDEGGLRQSSPRSPRREGSALNHSPSGTADIHGPSFHRSQSPRGELQRALDAPKKGDTTIEESIVLRLADVVPVNEVISAADVSNDGSCVWHSDGSHAAVIVRDAATGDMLARITTASVASTVHTTCSAIAAVGADALWAGFTDGTVIVFNTTTYKEAAVLRGHRGLVTCIAPSSSGAFVFSGSEDGTVRQYDAAFASLHNVLQQDASSAGGYGAVLALAAVDVPRLGQHNAFSTWLFTGMTNRTLQLWTAEHSEVSVEVCDAHEGALRAIAVEPYLRSKACNVRVWSASNDGRIRVWDATMKSAGHGAGSTPEMTFVTEFCTHTHPVIALRALEGRMLALSDDQTMSVYALKPPAQQRGDDDDTDPVFLAQVENGSRASAYSCIALGPVKMLRSVWCCGGLDRTVSIWDVPDVALSLEASSTALYSRRQSQPTLAAVADRYLGERETELTQIMRERVCQRAIGDCISEEDNHRYILQVEHERDLFRLLSLSDTLIRSSYSVTTDVYARDVTTIALVSHAQLGLTWMGLYEEMLMRMHAILRSVSISSLATDANTQRLIQNFRHIQTDLENKLMERTHLMDEQSAMNAKLKSSHETALARAEMLEADISDLQSIRDNLTTSAFALEKSLKASEHVVAELQRREAQHIEDKRVLERQLSDADKHQSVRGKDLDALGLELHAARRDEKEAKRECAALEHRVAQLEARLKAQNQRMEEEESTWTRRVDELRRKMLDAADEAERDHRSLKELTRQQIEHAREETKSLEAKLREQQRTMDQVSTRSTLTHEQHKTLQHQAEENRRSMEEAVASANRRWQEDVSRLEAALQEKSTKCDQLRAQLNTSESEHERCAAQAASLQRHFDQLRDEKVAVDERLRSVIDASRSAAQQQHQMVPNAVNRLRADLLAAQDALNQEREKVLQHEQLLNAAEEHYEHVQRQALEDVQNAKKAASIELSSRERKCDELQSKYEALLATNSSLAAEIHLLEDRVAAHEAAKRTLLTSQQHSDRYKIDALTAAQRVEELKEQLHDADERRRADVEAATSEFTATQQALREQLHHKAGQLAECELRKRALEAQAERSHIQMEEITACNQNLTDELAHVATTLSAVRGDRDKRIAEHEQHMRQAREDARRVEAELLQRVSSLEASLVKANESVALFEEQARTLASEKALIAAAKEADHQALIAQRTSLEQLIAKHERYVLESEEERNDLRVRLEAEASERQRLEVDTIGVSTKLKHVEQQRQQSEERLRSERHAESQTLMEKLSAAHDRCTTLSSQLAEQEALAARNSTSMAQMKFDLDAKSVELSTLMQALAKAREELSEAHGTAAALSIAQREVHELQKKVEEIRAREVAARQELKDLEALASETNAIAVRSIEGELASVREQLADSKSRESELRGNTSQQLLALEAKLRAAKLEAQRLQDDHDRTTDLLEEARCALLQAATPPSPLSPPSRTAAANGDRQAAITGILGQAILMQQQRDFLLQCFTRVWAPCAEDRTRWIAASFLQASQRSTDLALNVKRTAQVNEDNLRAAMHDLTVQRDGLSGTQDQRQQLIAEVQTELRELYARYKSEVDAHKRTKQHLMESNERTAPEIERMRTTIALYERELALRDDPTPVVSFDNSQEKRKQKEGICELLDGIRDAVDLLQPVSLDSTSLLGEHTLVALYEWLVSAQMRCEALALACDTK